MTRHMIVNEWTPDSYFRDDIVDEDNQMMKFLYDHGITFEHGPLTSKDQHGNKYVTVTIDGPHDEGGIWDYDSFDENPNMAVERYQKALLRFLGVNRHVIWRTEPVMSIREASPGSIECRVYSRLTAYPERPA